MALEDEELLLKQLPHSVEAEQAVLGSMLIDPRCVPEVIDKLRPDDFYLRQNREIYETIYSMFNYSLTIDPVTVLENMKQNGVYDENHSRSYMLQLMDTTPTAANVKEYIDILKDKTLLRRVAETAGDLTAMIQQGTDTGQDILEAAEQRIYAIRQGRSARGLTPISDVIIDVYDRLAELAARCQNEGIALTIVLPPMAENVRTEVCDPFGNTGAMQDEVLPELHAIAAETGCTLLDYEWNGSCITDNDTQFFDGFHLDEKYGLPDWTEELFTDIG